MIRHRLAELKTPGGRNDAGRRAQISRLSLEHAEHDGADEDECEIRGNNAQLADESHGNPPLVYVAAGINDRIYQTVPREKSQPRCLSAASAPRRAVGDVVKD